MVRGECAHLELLATFGPFGLSVVIENGLLQFLAANSHSLGVGSLGVGSLGVGSLGVGSLVSDSLTLGSQISIERAARHRFHDRFAFPWGRMAGRVTKTHHDPPPC